MYREEDIEEVIERRMVINAEALIQSLRLYREVQDGDYDVVLGEESLEYKNLQQCVNQIEYTLAKCHNPSKLFIMEKFKSLQELLNQRKDFNVRLEDNLQSMRTIDSDKPLIKADQFCSECYSEEFDKMIVLAERTVAEKDKIVEVYDHEHRLSIVYTPAGSFVRDLLRKDFL